MDQQGDCDYRPTILLTHLRQQREVRQPEDDWTGVVNRAGRRKLQNRLNQRAWR